MIDIPLIDSHAEAMTYAEVRTVCAAEADANQTPCVLIRQGERVCYALLDMQGNTIGNVQCFIETTEEDEQ